MPRDTNAGPRLRLLPRPDGIDGAGDAGTVRAVRGETHRGAIALLVQVALLLGALAVYLLVSDTGSGRDGGYAFVIAVHLGLLSAGCAALGLHLAGRRRRSR